MPTLEILSEEQETFERLLPELLGTAAGKWVLIHGNQMLGTFESRVDAINHGYQTLGNVPFLVKQVTAVEIPEYVSHVGI